MGAREMVVGTKGKQSLWLRVKRVVLPPKAPVIDLEPVVYKQAEMLERVRKLQATLDSEEDWFLCLTKDRKVCLNSDGDKEND